MTDMEQGNTQLRDWQWRRRLSGGEASDIIGIDRTYYSNLVNGRRRPGRDLAVKIERLTGVPVEAWTPQTSGKRDKATKRHASKSLVA